MDSTKTAPRQYENLSFQLSIYTPRPDITPCFEYTLLTWIPLATILVMLPLALLYHRGVPSLRIKSRTCLFTTKQVCTCALLLLYITDLGLTCFHTHLKLRWLKFLDAALRTIAMICVAVYTSWSYRKGIHTSFVLLFCWFILCVCDGIRVASHIAHNIDKVTLNYTTKTMQGLLYTEFFLECLMMLLHIPADVASMSTASSKSIPTEKMQLMQIIAEEEEISQRPCPQLKAGCLSYLYYLWFWGLVRSGLRKSLTTDDLWDVRPSESCEEVYPEFKRLWGSNTSTTLKARQGDHSKAWSVAWTLFRLPWWTIAFGLFLSLLQSYLTFGNSIILSALIKYVDSPHTYPWHGYSLAAALVITSIISALCTQHSYNLFAMAGIRMRVALTTAIYRKALRLPASSIDVGQITNLMAIDAYKIQEVFQSMMFLVATPFVLPFAVYILWQQLSQAALLGILWYVVVVPCITMFAGRLMRGYQMKLIVLKDARIRLTNQVLTGIKVLKFYAWEPAFQRRILQIREKELQLVRKSSLVYGLNGSIGVSTANLAAIMMFGMYMYDTGCSAPPVDVAFSVLSVLNSMRVNILVLPSSVSFFAQLANTCRRISKFMLMEELDTEYVTHERNQDQAVTLDRFSANWGGDQLILKGINFSVPRGKLVAIVGPVGSGKSSLISAILGEMNCVNGSVDINGTIAYVPQQAWIQNLTLRDNVLFGKKYVKSTYQTVLSNCCLQSDLKLLAGGDMTEIGERGINLSGGQNQRVSLARACYQDNDIYLLDDPLSAVDAHVGKDIFKNVIGPNGLLSDKTRLMVTNSLTFVDKVDIIVVLDKGCISEYGTFTELLQRQGPFTEFLHEHLRKKMENDDSDDSADGENGDEEVKYLIRHLASVSGSESDFSDYNADIETREKRRQRRLARGKKLKMKEESGTLIAEEMIEQGNISYSVFKALLNAASLACVLAALLGVLLFIAANLGSNIWLSVWTAQASRLCDIDTESNWHSQYYGLLIYTILSFAVFIGASMIAAGGLVGICHAASMLHTRLITTVLRFPMSFFDTTPKGRIISRFSKDIDTVDEQFRLLSLLLMFQLSTVLATIVAISVSTWMFLGIAAVVVALFVMLQRTYLTVARQLRRLETKQRSPVFAGFSETLSGLSSIRAYQQHQRFIENADHRLNKSVASFYALQCSFRWAGTYCGLLSFGVVAFTVFFAVTAGQEENAGIIGMAVMFALQFSNQLSVTLKNACEVECHLVSAENIGQYFDLPTEAAHEDPENQPPGDWPKTGGIEFKGLSMRYRPGLDLVLNDLNLSVKPGEKIGIVGRTGAGKSSMTLSLFRIIEAASGSIIIDGLDIARMGLHDVRKNLAIIPQEPVVFSGTIRENLDPYSQYTESEIWESLENSHLKDYISESGEGLDLECGEDGSNMSVGQRQLLCLARALLRKPRILVLDEATAAIDIHTDSLIQQTIRTEFKATTILTIAHRLNTILDYDRILVLDQGRTASFDTPVNLLKDESSIFYSMVMHAGLI